MLGFCKSQPDRLLRESFRDVLQGLNLRNVFNPSFYLGEKVQVFGFRAIEEGNDQLVSFLSIDDGESRRITALTPELSPLFPGRSPIDPKIFPLGDEVFATFNNGWVPGGNELFVMKLYPEMAPPKRVIYSGRQSQERNWAFFAEQGSIYALYQVAPLRLLRLVEDGPESWKMEECFLGENSEPALSLGTPLSRWEGRYGFVGHRKILIRGKKLYLGKYCEFDFRTRSVSAGKKWLVHSLSSLHGNRTKHNTNLFSCTYFSGLQTNGSTVRVGYGINDVDWGFSIYKRGEL